MQGPTKGYAAFHVLTSASLCLKELVRVEAARPKGVPEEFEITDIKLIKICYLLLLALLDA